MEGTVVGNWVIGRKIGEGGMGQVYFARHKTLHTEAAIKVLSHTLAYDAKFRERFFVEAQSQSSLQHPNIARILDYVEHRQRYYLVVELLRGGTLADLLNAAGGPLKISRALELSKQALRALDYAHQNRVIHRDVKPSNIMLDEHGRVRVMDFGIALVMKGDRMTTAGVAIGTAEYMSPEQITRPREVDHRTDVYSMGLVLYELLTGRVPFEGDTEFAIKAAQVNDQPPPLTSINPEIPDALERIVMRALAKQPDYRYSGCGEFARTIESYERNGGASLSLHNSSPPKNQLLGISGTKTIIAPRSSRSRVVAQPDQRKKRRVVLFLAASFLIVCAAAAATGYVWWNSTNKLDQYYKMRDGLESNRKWSEVESEYRERIRTEPNNALLYGLLIETLMQQEKYPEAEAAARDAIRLEPNEALWYDLLGDALSKQRTKNEDAGQAYSNAIQMEIATAADRHVYMGDLAAFHALSPGVSENQRLQYWKEAENYYRDAIKRKPDRPLLISILATVIDNQIANSSERSAQKWSEPEALHRQAVRLAPKKAEYHWSLGNCLAGQERWPEAENEYREAVGLNSFPASYHATLGQALEKQAKGSEALTEYKEAVSLEPNIAKYHDVLGAALVEQKQWKESEAQYREAIRLDPNIADYHVLLGRVLLEQKRFKDAEDPLRHALEINPQVANGHDYLGVSLVQQEKWVAAEDEFRQATLLDHTSSWSYYGLGLALMRQSKWSEAEAALKDAIRRKADDAMYYGSLGACELQLHRPDDAETAYKKAVELDPKNNDYRKGLQHARAIRKIRK